MWGGREGEELRHLGGLEGRSLTEFEGLLSSVSSVQRLTCSAWSYSVATAVYKQSQFPREVLAGFESGRVAVYRTFFPEDFTEKGDLKTLEEAGGGWGPSLTRGPATAWAAHVAC